MSKPAQRRAIALPIPPETEDADTLAADSQSGWEALLAPFSGLHELVAERYASRGRYEQPNGHVGDIVGQHVRRSAVNGAGRAVVDQAGAQGFYLDAAAAAEGQIDGIGADAVDCDQLERRQRIDDLAPRSDHAARDNAADLGPVLLRLLDIDVAADAVQLVALLERNNDRIDEWTDAQELGLHRRTFDLRDNRSWLRKIGTATMRTMIEAAAATDGSSL